MRASTRASNFVASCRPRDYRVRRRHRSGLILRAYRAWGEDCVHHLLGDFAFAIWDAPERRSPATISA